VASITFLSNNNVASNNIFSQSVNLLEVNLEYEKQKLRQLTNVSGDAHNMIKFTGVEESQGNVIDVIYLFNNIGDLAVTDLYPGDEFEMISVIVMYTPSTQIYESSCISHW
jgi:hypothetical protein